MEVGAFVGSHQSHCTRSKEQLLILIPQLPQATHVSQLCSGWRLESSLDTDSTLAHAVLLSQCWLLACVPRVLIHVGCHVWTLKPGAQAVGDYISSKGRIAQKPIQLLSEAMWAYAVLGCHHRRMLDAIMQRVLYHIRNCPPTVLSQVSFSLRVCTFGTVSQATEVPAWCPGDITG